MRLESLKSSYTTWSKKDSNSAQTWLESNTSLTQSEREALTR